MNYLKGLKHTRFIRFLRHANLLKYKKITPRKVLKFQLQSNTVMSPSSSSSEVYTTAFKAKIFHRICNNPAKLFCHCWTSKKHSIADYLNRKRLVPRACVYSVHIEYLSLHFLSFLLRSAIGGSIISRVAFLGMKCVNLIKFFPTQSAARVRIKHHLCDQKFRCTTWFWNREGRIKKHLSNQIQYILWHTIFVK